MAGPGVTEGAVGNRAVHGVSWKGRASGGGGNGCSRWAVCLGGEQKSHLFCPPLLGSAGLPGQPGGDHDGCWPSTVDPGHPESAPVSPWC